MRAGKRHPLWTTWSQMVSRCKNPEHPAFSRYGGRGITVCDQWLDFGTFVADVGERPAGASIDRIDNGRGYEPGNVRWADRKQQGRNKRNNHLVTAHGETLPISAWAEKTGLSGTVIRRRIAHLGWSHEDAVSRPATPNRPAPRRGEANARARMTEAIVAEIRQRTDFSTVEAARHFGVHRSTIRRVRNGQAWGHTHGGKVVLS